MYFFQTERSLFTLPNPTQIICPKNANTGRGSRDFSKIFSSFLSFSLKARVYTFKIAYISLTGDSFEMIG
jgi:hypothetical protein